jgi:hypothetical protein
MFELLRDYWLSDISFKDGNMATLRKLTSPQAFTFKKDLISPENSPAPAPENYKLNVHQIDIDKKEEEVVDTQTKELGIATGLLKNIEKKSINQSFDYKLEDFKILNTHKFFNNKNKINSSNNTLQNIIFVPKALKNGTIEQ